MSKIVQFQHKFSADISEGVHIHGVQVWRPAVSEPMYVTTGLPWYKRWNENNWRPQCGCGQIFDTRQAYIEHYIYWAVWQDESGYIPGLLQKSSANVSKQRVRANTKPVAN